MNYKFLILSATIILSGCSSFSGDVSKSSIKNYIEEFDIAFKYKDINKISSLISDSAEIYSETTLNGSTENTKLNKEEYLSGLKNLWGSSSNYVCKNGKSKIAISSDIATVTRKVQESMQVGENQVVSLSKTIVTIEFQNEKLLAVKAVSKSSVGIGTNYEAAYSAAGGRRSLFNEVARAYINQNSNEATETDYRACISYGIQPNTQQMSTCVMTEAQNRKNSNSIRNIPQHSYTCRPNYDGSTTCQ